jgi:hypothetical protein
MTLVDLMRTTPEQRDINWLRTALQSAVELEMATIPPYLCALWSIKDPAAPAAGLIRTIVLEEMNHMGLACNMLVAAGGTPRINTPSALPTYPGELPGRVHPGLIVPLAALSKDLILDVFMEIELPESGPTRHHRGYAYPTIGAFYDALLAAFNGLTEPKLQTDNQLALDFNPEIGLTKITSVADAAAAIGQIKQQGEGTPQSPIGDPGFPDTEDKFAHYYKFAEIYHGAGLRLVDGLIEYTGTPIAFPDVYPMATVPPEGYPTESAAFDQLFKIVLDGMQLAWETGDPNALNDAIFDGMDSLGEAAVALMKTPIPGSAGNFGPDFKIPI